MKKIEANELAQQLKDNKVTILDVRSEAKFTEQHINHENATCTNIPKGNIFNMEESGYTLPDDFSKDEEIIIACTTSNSATKCANILKKQGYNVTVLDGGITSWNKHTK